MPTAGFKSITVPDKVYFNFYETWLKSKDEFAFKGVSSFSGYITNRIEEVIQKNHIFTKYQQVFTKISVDENRIVIKDFKINRIIELKNDHGTLFCLFCDRDNCPHVGFCWSFPEIYGDKK